ncbi:MAG: septum site-determining protein MinC [Lachnospiraceae bacterium]|nr:septum site-determining protein MinC [Lachnospiraceae bacterium]
MKEAVLIKSYQNGISLILSDECSFEDLLHEIAARFSQARNFFGTARMALSIDGRTLDCTEELQVIDTIRQNSDLNIVCVIGKDEPANQRFISAIEETDRRISPDGGEGQFYKGTLKNNQTLETERSIVVLGDVYPGSTIISARDIIILGGLYGEAYAGGNGSDSHYVVALEMEPEKLKIGDFKYKSSAKPKWGIRPKVQPKIAYVKNSRLVMEPLTKELLESF